MATAPVHNLRSRVCLVTGASGGIGRETALGLTRSGATVLMVARDSERGERAAADIRTQAPEGAVELFVTDLADQQAVRELARQVQLRHTRLDVLIHNAAAVNNIRRLTADGIEATLAVNHLAPFLLTHLLEPTLTDTPGARVVTVSSYMHTRVKKIPWEDLQFEHGYSASAAYNLSKLMNILFTVQLARRWSGASQTANTLHPGWPLKTNLGREQQGAGGVFDRATKLVGASAAKGARTTLYLASSPDVAGTTGSYFARSRPGKSSALSRNDNAAQRLWDLSAQLCGVTWAAASA